MTATDSATAARREKLNRRIGFATAVLLSISALCTSWAGYQATLWGGEQTTHAYASGVSRTRSTRASTLAWQQRQIDLAVFTSWLAAYAQHDSALADFYEHRFRAEFAPAFQRWMSMHPLRNPDAPATPFEMSEYRVALDEQAATLERDADRAGAAAGEANNRGDAYVLEAVILAMVMFFAGAAQQAESMRVKVTLAVIALLICCEGVIRLAFLPRL